MNLYELTTAKLDQYTKAADADYEKAKAAGDYKKSLKRASGMMKASGKKIDNDVKALQKARGVAEATEYGIPDSTPGQLPGGAKMTFGEFKKMWPGVILKRPSGGSLAGSVVADVEGWMNNPKSVWEPLQGVAENNMPPPQQSSTQDTSQQAKVRAALEKGLQISDKNDADEVRRKTAQNDKRVQRLGSIAGASPEPVRREGGWDSRGIRAIVSIEPDGTIVIDGSDYHDLASLKQLLAWGGMAGAKLITRHAFKQQQGVAEGSLDDIEEMDRRGFLKGLGAVAATAAVPSLAQAGSAIDYNKVQMLHDQMFKKNPQYAKEWQAANGARVRAFIKSKDPKFRDRATARKARLDMTAKILQKYGMKDLNENQFDPINDDDYYEYNVNTKEIVKRISGKHPIASKFNPLQREWAGRDADHKIVKGMYAKYLKPTVDEKVSDYLPAPLVNKHSIVKGWRKDRGLDEKAPPGDKAERMVKHIKKGYAKDGKLTDKEKSIAYATAWKAHNAGKV